LGSCVPRGVWREGFTGALGEAVDMTVGIDEGDLGLALGLAACQRGFTVSFTTAVGLVHQLMEARDEKRFRKKTFCPREV